MNPTSAIEIRRFVVNVGMKCLGTFDKDRASDALKSAGAPICIVGMRLGQTFTAPGGVSVKRVV